MKKLSIIALTLFSFQLFAGGGWVKNKDEGYSQFSLTTLQYNGIFTDDGSTIIIPRKVTDLTLQGYLEYGLIDNLEFQMVVPYKMVSTSDVINDGFNPFYTDTLESGRLQGLGNVYTALKYGLGSGKFAHALRLGYGWNPTRRKPAKGLQTGYNTPYVNATYFISKGFNNTYINLDLGYQLMFNNYTDYISTNLEAGHKIKFSDSFHLWAALVVQYYKAVESSPEIKDFNYLHTGLAVNGEEHFSPGLKFALYFKENFALNYAMYGAISASYQGTAPTNNIGVSYEWK